MNFQVSTTILNTCTKKSGNLLNAPRTLCSEVKDIVELNPAKNMIDR